MVRLLALLALVLSTAAPPHLAEARPASARPGPPDPIAADVGSALAELRRDGDRVRALAILGRLAELEGDVADTGPIAAAYERVAEDRRAHPEVRAAARWQLARVERARGNLNRSEAQAAELGFIRGWWVVGPFDDEGKRGHGEAYPPEAAQDPAARYDGKVREVGWRELPAEATTLGFVHLGAVLRPNREVVAYALAQVRAPRTERVRLHFGGSGAMKVWVNGALALADPTYHPARLDQHAVAVTLRQGPNRILVKLAHQQGAMGFHARAVRMNGDPLPLSGLPPPWDDVRPGADTAPERLPTAVDALQARIAAAEARRVKPTAAERAALYVDLAIAEQLRSSGDERDRLASEAARTAAGLAPGSRDAQLLAARLEEDVNRRREYLEAALRAAPGDPRALAALARHHLERGDADRAVPLLKRALAAAPAFVEAKLLLADGWGTAGLLARARREHVEIAREHPHVLAAVLAAARAEREQDRPDAAIPLLRTALALRFDSAAARALLVQALLDRGSLDEALARLDDGIRLDPSMLDERLRRADLLAANGRHDEAEAGYAAALRIAPEDAETLEHRGEARLRAGQTREALADLNAALELRPQDPQLKELVRALEPDRERFEAPYVQDARELARAWNAAHVATPAPSNGAGEDAVILSDLHVTRVQRSGLSSTYTQLVVKVLTQRGVDRFRSDSVAYVPGRQEVRVDRVRVLKPDGTSVETYGDADRSASEPWYRMYYDTRARVLSFPALAPGDVLELAVRRDDVSSENLLSDYFGEVVYLADTTRKLRTDYVLLAPASRRIHSNQPALPAIEHGVRTLAGGLVEHRWTARDVAAIRPEPGMPGWSEVSPFVHVSTYASWAQVSRFYWGLVREQLEPDAEVRAAARRIADEVLTARGKPAGSAIAREDELAVIRAVHAFVVTNTRYVGLEIGIHGYKPYRADQVLERRFGDCKDKASLAYSLLRALGIDSRLVLLRMKRLGDVGAEPASLAVFNHAILRVPQYDLWLDGTATYSGSTSLPGEDRGADVLVVNPDGDPWFGRIPEARPEENVVQNRVETTIAPDGSATVRGVSRIVGVDAPRYRRAYQAERDRQAAFEHAFSATFPGLRVKEVALTGLARLEEPIDLTYAIEVPRFAARDRDALDFLPFGMVPSYAEAWAALSSRQYDLVLGDPQENRFTFRHALPAGWRAAALPPPVRLEGPYASLDVAYRMDGGVLVAEGRVVLKQGRVKAADYPAFRQFAAQLDRALARPIRLVPPSP